MPTALVWIVGAALLIAMWSAHLTLFRGGGWAACVGIVIVLQNVVSSLAHSHLFDFTQGWLYIFGVGVTGGMTLKKSDASSANQIEDRASA
jgi:O-antigen ligase